MPRLGFYYQYFEYFSLIVCSLLYINKNDTDTHVCMYISNSSL